MTLVRIGTDAYINEEMIVSIIRDNTTSDSSMFVMTLTHPIYVSKSQPEVARFLIQEKYALPIIEKNNLLFNKTFEEELKK